MVVVGLGYHITVFIGLQARLSLFSRVAADECTYKIINHCTVLLLLISYRFVICNTGVTAVFRMIYSANPAVKLNQLTDTYFIW